MNNLYNLKNNIKLDKIKGFCTEDGCNKFINSLDSKINKINYNYLYKSKVQVSRIGLGSYLGKPELEDDIKIFNSLNDIIFKYGINNIDTAINYRYMRSEKALGYKFNNLFINDIISRESLFIASKGGFISPEYYESSGVQIEDECKDLINRNIINSEDIIAETYCNTNKYLKYSLNKSLSNLGLETLDLYYLHNPAETTMAILGEDKFYKQIEKNFEFLEDMVFENKIKNYGISSWICFRARPEEKEIYLNLEKIHKIAKKVGGKNHHFKFIQLPINLIMHEAYSQDWQELSFEMYNLLKDKYNKEIFHNKKLLSILDIAKELNINVFSSNPLYQSFLIKNFPIDPLSIGCSNKGEANLSITKSLPYESLKSVLVGNKEKIHYDDNLITMEKDNINWENLFKEFNKLNSNLNK